MNKIKFTGKRIKELKIGFQPLMKLKKKLKK